MSDVEALREAARTGIRPECDGSLARGSAALSCRSCSWSTSLEDTAAFVGWST